MKSWWQTGASVTGAAMLLFAWMPEASAQQCIPAVANPAAYERCHIRKVRGHEVCRCALASPASASHDGARAAVAWGTLTGAPSDWTTRSLTLGSYSPSNPAAPVLSPLSGEGGDSSGRDSGSSVTNTNAANTASASAATGAGISNAQPAMATSGTSSFPEPGSAVPGLGIAGPNGSIRSDNIPAPVNP